MSTYAQAGEILLSPGDAAYSGDACAPDCGPGTSDILAWLDAEVDGFDSSDELYKSNEDGDQPVRNANHSMSSIWER